MVLVRDNMRVEHRTWLLPAAFNAAVGVLHLAIVLGGPAWYRVFGAGDGMADMAELGAWEPALLTLGSATVFTVWCCFALSAAGVLRRFWLLRPALCTITLIFLVRGLAGLAAPLFYNHPAMALEGMGFWIWSSLICVVIGLVHLNALVDTWDLLARPRA